VPPAPVRGQFTPGNAGTLPDGRGRVQQSSRRNRAAGRLLPPVGVFRCAVRRGVEELGDPGARGPWAAWDNLGHTTFETTEAKRRATYVDGGRGGYVGGGRPVIPRPAVVERRRGVTGVVCPFRAGGGLAWLARQVLDRRGGGRDGQGRLRDSRVGGFAPRFVAGAGGRRSVPRPGGRPRGPLGPGAGRVLGLV